LSRRSTKAILEIIEKRIDKIENRLNSVEDRVAELCGKMSSVHLLVKWVIFPLLVILAGLVGIKIVVP